MGCVASCVFFWGLFVLFGFTAFVGVVNAEYTFLADSSTSGIVWCRGNPWAAWRWQSSWLISWG